jgi:hypothetical protein
MDLAAERRHFRSEFGGNGFDVRGELQGAVAVAYLDGAPKRARVDPQEGGEFFDVLGDGRESHHSPHPKRKACRQA